VDFKEGWIQARAWRNEEMARAGRFLSSPELREVLQAQRERTRETGQIVPWLFHRNGEQLQSLRKAMEAFVSRRRLSGPDRA
jgi:hypothetical protein